MTASVTVGRALRYADSSARGLLHHHRGHDLIANCALPEYLGEPLRAAEVSLRCG